MSGALALMMARARFNHLAAVAAGITIVGTAFGSPFAGTLSITLPAGAAAGDQSLLLFNSGADSGGFDADVTGMREINAASQYFVSGSVYAYLADYIYVLTSTDVSNGYIQITLASGSGSMTSAQMVLLRAASDVEKVAGPTTPRTEASTTAATGAMIANGITVPDNSLLVYHAALTFGGVGQLSFGAGPTGYTLGASTEAEANSPQLSYYKAFATGAASGDVSVDETYAHTEYFGAWLLALKPAEPHILITLSLPDATIGSTYSGTITAENKGGATGAITLSGVTGIPSGLTLGTRTGSGPYVWGFDGTVTGSATTTTIAGTASNGTSAQDETFSQAVAVVAASSGPTLISVTPATPSVSSSPSVGIELDIGAVLAGDQIVVGVTNYADTGIVTTFTDSQSNTFDTPVNNEIALTLIRAASRATIGADDSDYKVTVYPSKRSIMTAVAYLLRGKTLALDTANVYGTVEQIGTNPLPVGPYSTSAAAFILLLGDAYQGSTKTLSLNTPTDYTVDATTYNSVTAHWLTSAAVSGDTQNLSSDKPTPDMAALVVPYIWS